MKIKGVSGENEVFEMFILNVSILDFVTETWSINMVAWLTDITRNCATVLFTSSVLTLKAQFLDRQERFDSPFL